MSTCSKRAREQKKAEKKRRKRQRRDEKRDLEPAEPEIVTREEIVGQLKSPEQVLRELHDGPAGVAPSSAAPIPSKLFVGRLSDSTTSESLREHFESVAPISLRFFSMASFPSRTTTTQGPELMKVQSSL